MKSVLTKHREKHASISGIIPNDLICAIHNIYTPSGMQLTDEARCETESAEYGASRFGLDGNKIVFRVAKTTPTKIGQFVTIWKRSAPGSTIMPLDLCDDIDFVVISVLDSAHRGQFIFDKKILVSKGVIAINGRGGKRAIRVYPPWVEPIAKEAIRTQQWQLRYFLALEQSGFSNIEETRRLFGV